MGGGTEDGTCEVLRPCYSSKFGTCTDITNYFLVPFRVRYIEILLYPQTFFALIFAVLPGGELLCLDYSD